MRGLSPLLFVGLVAAVLLAYVGSAHEGGDVVTALGAAAAAAALAGLCVHILRTDSRLAAAEAVSLGLPVGEALHEFERSGRSALLVFTRSDRLGRLVEAFAYDPDDD